MKRPFCYRCNEEQSRYIGRGHLLGDEQFNLLWKYINTNHGFRLLKQYVETGQAIPETQYNVLVSNNG